MPSIWFGFLSLNPDKSANLLLNNYIDMNIDTVNANEFYLKDFGVTYISTEYDVTSVHMD